MTECLKRCRSSRKLVLVIVFVALFLDNMLLTTVGQYISIYWNVGGLENVYNYVMTLYILCCF